jgi:pimeloyl-ACP methyl ester carboxylesterase
MRFLAFSVLLAVLAAFFVPVVPVAAAPLIQRTAAFEPGECTFDLPPGVQAGQDVECGTLTVPARHAEPSGPTIRLAVAIVKSTGSNPAPAPLVMLQGGPGGSTIDTYSQLLFLPQGQRLLREHDVVLFDQRGTLYSQPALTCEPEERSLIERTIEQDLSDEEGERLSQEALLACRARLLEAGGDLSAFDSLENAADVEALRMALGYEQINLYGVSYGSLLALHVMREHPQGLRSVILDAVVPTQTNFIPEVPRSQDRAFGELFRACAEDPDCNAAFPDLEQRTFALADRLDQTPARVPVTDPESGTTYQMVMDGDTFLSFVFQLLYASNILPGIPLMIERTEAGDHTFLSGVAPLFIFDRTIASGMYYSVICAEDADFTPGEVDLSGVRPRFAEGAERDLRSFEELCIQWQVEQLPDSVDAPVTSDIPTLVLNGRFDPITPPAFGQAASETLANSYVFIFGNTGHGAMLADPCPTGIALEFLANPRQRPDDSCIAANPAPEFLARDAVLPTDALRVPLAWFEGRNLAQLGVLVITLLLLLSPFLVWPLAWLVRTIRGRAAGVHRGIGRARLLAGLLGLLAFVFVFGLAGVIIAQATQSEVLLLFGVPAWSAPLFVLPLLLALLAIGLLVVASLGWLGRGEGTWTGWQRGYYTVLALAAVGFVAVLGSMGMLRVLI